jgi:hypothetical protein
MSSLRVSSSASRKFWLERCCWRRLREKVLEVEGAVEVAGEME